jgi:hypothetical protein
LMLCVDDDVVDDVAVAIVRLDSDKSSFSESDDAAAADDDDSLDHVRVVLESVSFACFVIWDARF